jgi:hypothetical protein
MNGGMGIPESVEKDFFWLMAGAFRRWDISVKLIKEQGRIQTPLLNT